MNNIKKYGDIVKKQFAVSKKRSISTVLGIILSIILFTTVGYIFSYNNDISIRKAKLKSGNYEAIIKELSEEDISILKNDLFVDNLGVYKELYSESVRIEDMKKNIKLYAVDDVILNEIFNLQIELTSGRFPENSQEIIVDNIGEIILNKNIGDIASFSGKDYKIVGFYRLKEYVQPSVVNIITKFDEGIHKEKVNAVINVKGNKEKDIIINNIIKNLGINNNFNDRTNRIVFNNNLLNSYGVEMNSYTNKNIFEKHIQGIIYFLVLILTTFLIYGSINVSIKERTNQISILRCIGATQSKIRNLLIKESFFLLIFSLIPGIIIGQCICFFISDIMLNKLSKIKTLGVTYKIYYNVLIMAIVLTIINVVIATVIPIIRLRKVSPIEGVKKSGIEKIKNKRRNSRIIKRLFGYDGALAYKNIKGDYKSFIISTIVSAIILTIFIVFTGYQKNIIMTYRNSKNSSKDILLNIAIKHKKEYKDILDEFEAYKKEINEIGVSTDIYGSIYYTFDGLFKDVKLNRWVDEIDKEYIYGEENRLIGNINHVYSNRITLLVLDDKSLSSILPSVNNKNNLELNDFKENGVLIAERMVLKNYIQPSNENLFNLQEGDEFTLLIQDKKIFENRKEIDEEVNYILDNNKEVKFKYLGSINGANIFNGKRYGLDYSTALIVSEDFYKKNLALFNKDNDNYAVLEPNSIDFSIDFRNDINRSSALQAIDYYSNKIESLYIDNKEERKSNEQNITSLTIIIYTILALIIIIGSINIINNKILGIKLRNEEIGILLAIGISKKRLKKIIMLEGIVQWFISVLLSLVLSYPMLIVLFKVSYYFSQLTIIKMPIGAMVFGFLLLFLVNVIASYLSIKNIEYTSTTELIRNNE